MMRQQSKLDAGEIEKVVRSLRTLETADLQLADKIRGEAGYFERNATRMRYPQFRRQKLFIGSGVIEAGWQICDWQPPQTIRHVLDTARCQCHHRPPLSSPQPQVRGLLGFPLKGRLSLPTKMSRTPYPVLQARLAPADLFEPNSPPFSYSSLKR
jgi:hypothetical protein